LQIEEESRQPAKGMPEKLKEPLRRKLGLLTVRRSPPHLTRCPFVLRLFRPITSRRTSTACRPPHLAKLTKRRLTQRGRGDGVVVCAGRHDSTKRLLAKTAAGQAAHGGEGTSPNALKGKLPLPNKALPYNGGMQSDVPILLAESQWRGCLIIAIDWIMLGEWGLRGGEHHEAGVAD
jgi:hypothetical protein